MERIHEREETKYQLSPGLGSVDFPNGIFELSNDCVTCVLRRVYLSTVSIIIHAFE